MGHMMKTKINRQIVKGEYIFVKGTFCEVISSLLVDCKMIVTPFERAFQFYTLSNGVKSCEIPKCGQL